MAAERFIIGIDGGGSKTAAWLANVAPDGTAVVIGRGSSGAVNIQSVGTATALENLDHALNAAFREAKVERGKVDAAVLCLAGSSREENQRVFRSWADHTCLAHNFEIVSDALPVLAAASPQGLGVALLSGTGSFAFGRNTSGKTARSGGWGFLFGDEGSGYWIAVAALRAVVRAADGRGPATQLVDLVLDRLEIQSPQELVSAVYPKASDRAWLAAMARLVTEADRQQDLVAREILDSAASELASMVAAVAHSLGFADRAYCLGLAGGTLLQAGMIERVELQLRRRDLYPSALRTVPEPVAGAVQLACDLARTA